MNNQSRHLCYDEALGDAGAIALAQALPPTLHELGLVGCGIGDQGCLLLFEGTQPSSILKIESFQYLLRGFAYEKHDQTTRV